MDTMQRLSHSGITWYHSNKSTTKIQRDELVKKFGFLAHHVASTEKGKTPRPKISINKKYIYLVLHIPYLPANSSKLYVCDLNVFITDNALITIESQGILKSLDAYFEKTKTSSRLISRRFKLGSGNLCLNILKYLLEDLETLIDAQGEKVDTLNREVFVSTQAKNFIETISILRYNQIVAFSAIDRQNRAIDLYANDKNPFERFNDKTSNKWTSIAETYQTLSYELASDIEHLEGLVRTFETLVTHRTNEVIKVLTIFSVILLPLNLITGAYGMNLVNLPISQHPLSFGIITLLMAALVLVMIAVFKLKKWL